MIKERIYLILGCFLIGAGSYIIHPGFGIMVIHGNIFKALVEKHGNKDHEEGSAENSDR